MIKYVIGFLVFTVNWPAVMFGQGIAFSDEYWEEAIERAEEEGKMLFVDCYTTWCGPCKKMDKMVFPVDSVGAFYNKHFINLKLDMESKDGKKFAERYEVKAYPTYLILNASGEVVVRSCGYQPAGRFIKFGKTGVNAEVSLFALRQRYKNWDRDPEFLYNYFKVLKEGCFPVNDMVENHLNGLMPIEMAKSANWRIFNEFVFDLDVKATQNFLTNSDVYVKVQGKKVVFDKAIGLYQREMSRSYDKKDGKTELTDRYKSYNQQIGSAPVLWKDALLTMNELYYNGARKEHDKYTSLAKELIKKRDVMVPAVLNDIGRYYLEYIQEPKQLKEMSGWIKPIYTDTENPMFYVTYAAVLYKIGEHEKAGEVEAKMLMLGEELGSNMIYLKEKLEEYKN